MRNQFTFYRSFWEAIAGLPSKTKLTVIEAVCEYALDNQEPQLSGVAKTVFLLIKPTLDTSARRSESGRVGGTKQSASKTQANDKQTAREKEREGEKEKENEIEVEVESDSYTRACARLLASCLPEGVNSVEDWYSMPGYEETKARIALMRASTARSNGNEDEAQRWAALAEAGGLRVDRDTLTAP